MSLCVATTAVALTIAAEAFTLAWTHSVEKTEWRERWRVQAGTLVLEEARVRGSGAGMDPPEGSVLQGGWWVYRAERRLEDLRLAVSGATGGGWRLCLDGQPCRDLEAWLRRDGVPPDAIRLSARTPCRPLHRDALTR